jgi:DNA-binding transcriptional ArsR family regulator
MMNTDSRADSTDDTLRLLADERRRTALRFLIEGDGPTTVDEVAERVAADAGDDRPVERVRVDLHHTHLPKMDEAGVVDYDARRGTVRYRQRAAVEELLDAVSERERVTSE